MEYEYATQLAHDPHMYVGVQFYTVQVYISLPPPLFIPNTTTFPWSSDTFWCVCVLLNVRVLVTVGYSIRVVDIPLKISIDIKLVLFV